MSDSAHDADCEGTFEVSGLGRRVTSRAKIWRTLGTEPGLTSPIFRPKFGGVFSTPPMFFLDECGLPSGKHTKNYGISPFLLAKSTISMAIFNGYVRPWRRFQTLHRHRSMLLGHGHCSRWFLYVFFFKCGFRIETWFSTDSIWFSNWQTSGPLSWENDDNDVWLTKSFWRKAFESTIFSDSRFIPTAMGWYEFSIFQTALWWIREIHKIYDISDLADDDGIATRGETEGKKRHGSRFTTFLGRFWSLLEIVSILILRYPRLTQWLLFCYSYFIFASKINRIHQNIQPNTAWSNWSNHPYIFISYYIVT